MKEDEHPSFYLLDSLAAGADVTADVIEHLSRCERCARHLAGLRVAEELPAWAALAAARKTRPRLLVPVAAGALAAAAAGLLLSWGSAGLPSAFTRPSADHEFATTRGTPTVGVFIKRGEQVSLWDGQQALEPGDRLRLKVIPEGFQVINVFARDPSGRLALLFGARVSTERELLLPKAWEVDDSPGDEQLLVVLSNAPLTAAEAVAIPANDAAHWSRWLRFTKRAHTNPEAGVPGEP